MDAPPNSLKRKRELLPLGTPPPQLTPTPSSSAEQRGVLRVNRACNTCRRQKMRCEGPEDPPCTRCKNAGTECVFERVPPNKSPVISTPGRIAALEKKIEIIQSTQNEMHDSIREILCELRRRGPTSESPATHPMVAGDHLAGWKPASRSPFEPDASLSSSSGARDTPRSALSPPKILKEVQHLNSPAASLRIPSLPPIQSLLSPYDNPPEYPFASHSRFQAGSHMEDDAPSPRVPLEGSLPQSTARNNPVEMFRHSNSWPHAGPSHTPSGTVDSIESPEQPGKFDKASEPEHGDFENYSEDVTHHINVSAQGSHAKTRTGNRLEARQILREDSGNRVWNPDDPIKEFRTEDSMRPDAIERGLLNEQEARALLNHYFEQCYPRLPIFDPKCDTFDSLRYRSSFCFCCILMVATKTRDGGNPPSALQLALWEEAMLRAKASMFERVKDLEVIQALFLLSAWCESTGGTSWILLGHAIRCGVDIGIHKSLGKLTSEPSNGDEEATRVLVCSARVWCALFAFEHQLSFGIGRYTMTGSPKTVKTARETLLRHRFSNPNDMRLIMACEIMALEYQVLESFPNTDPKDPNCQRILQDARSRMDIWYSEWETLLRTVFAPEHYMVQALAVHWRFGYMTVHMACMPRNIGPAELDALSPIEKETCIQAISASREIVKIAVERESYRDGLRYSPTCFYSGVSFAGAVLLRLGSILSEKQEHNASLAHQLSVIMRDVPMCRFQFSLVTLLKEYQQRASSSDTSIPSGTDYIDQQFRRMDEAMGLPDLSTSSMDSPSDVHNAPTSKN